MTLPTKISPNPLVTSTVELRFKLRIDSQSLFPTVFKKFVDDFSEVDKGNIPDEVKKIQPELFKYHPDFIFKNDNYSLSLSNYSIRFENISEYPLWDNYLKFISNCINKFLELDILESVERIGLRYASIFEYNDKGINEILNSVPSLSIIDNSEFVEYSSRITQDKYKLLLQINSNQKIEKESKEISGLFIDIDAYYKESIESISYENVMSIIGDLHTYEKKVFFSLLKKSFIDENLNPQY